MTDLWLCGEDAGIEGSVCERIKAANVAFLFEIGGKELVEHLVLHLLTAHEIALEDEAMGICRLADDSLEVAAEGDRVEGTSRARRGHVEGHVEDTSKAYEA